MRGIAVTLVLSAVASAGVWAQEYALVLARVGSRTMLAEVDVSVGGFGAMREVRSLPDNFHYPRPVVISGGRYVVWFGAATFPYADRLFVLDRRTRAVFDATHLLPPGRWLNIQADPLRPRVILTGIDPSIVLFDLTTMTARAIASGRWSQFVYAAAADVLLLKRSDPLGVPMLIEAIEVATGAVRHSIPVNHRGNLMRVDRLARRLFVSGYQRGEPIAAFDLPTGQLVAQSSSQGTVLDLQLDEERLRLLAVWESGLMAVINADTLALDQLVRVSGDPHSLFNITRAHPRVLPGRWMTGAYVLRVEERVEPRTCNAIEIDSRDPDWPHRATADVLSVLGPGGNGCFANAILVRSPFAPTALTAAVSGRRVTLNWQNPGDVTEFELQAGLAPGATALTRRVGFETTTMTFDNVPPGVYYVRVRAYNEVGGSPVSNEIQVAVR